MTESTPPSIGRRRFLQVTAAGVVIAVPVGMGYGLYRIGSGQTPEVGQPYAALPAQPAGEGPAPILVLINTQGAGPFNGYLPEILRAEGIVASDAVELDESLRLDDLMPYALVILSEGSLSATQEEALLAYVAQGGRLLALAPPESIAEAAGLERFATGVEQRYLTIDGERAPEWMAAPTTQIHGRADHYRPGAADVLAWLGRPEDGELKWPAVVMATVGTGSLALTTFDPVESIVLMRQGNPASVDQERDGRVGLRAADLFVDWVDLDLIEVPQADLQMRFFSRLLQELLDDRLPLPRFWYFPDAAPSVLVATGDSHASTAATLEEILALVETYGGAMSIYHTPPMDGTLRRGVERAQSALTDALPTLLPDAVQQSQPTPGDVAGWRARGHEFGLHPYVEEGLEAGWERYWRAFTANGFAPVPPTTRTHAILWSGWVETARVQAAFSMRMNLDFYHYGPVAQTAEGEWRDGYLTGSGLPMRFVDEQGRLLGIYQQLTHLVDEHLLQMPWGLGGSNLTVDEAIEVSRKVLTAAVERWPAAIVTQFHVDPFALGQDLRDRSASWIEGTLGTCRDLGVPIISAERLLRYAEMREGASIRNAEWDATSGEFSFGVSFAPASGDESAGLLLPATFGGRTLNAVVWGDDSLTWRTTKLAGRDYGLVEVPAQAGRMVARYAASGS